MPGDWSGNVQMTDDAAKAVFADAQVGQVIRVAVKDVAEGAQGSFKNSVGARLLQELIILTYPGTIHC